MQHINWWDAIDPRGARTREFRITREEKRDITGALWTPSSLASDRVLVCCGHGASGDRYQSPIPYLAQRFLTEAALPVLALDGPVHGLRQVGNGGREAFWPEFDRDRSIVEMTEDWTCALSEIRALGQVAQGPLAYFGLSMGSMYGIPLLASRNDVVVATLGLLGVESGLRHDDELLAAASDITCPVLFLVQLEDELFTREGCMKIFDQITTDDKVMHANPGLHPEVPAAEIDFAYDFITSHVEGTSPPREVNPFTTSFKE